jgi:hypothetical protein
MRARSYYPAGMVLFSALALQTPAWRDAVDAHFQDSFQLAKDTHPAQRFKESDDRNTDDDFSPTTSSRPLRSGTKLRSSPRGYDARRVQRFWRNYHGAKPEKKEKPLDHEK